VWTAAIKRWIKINEPNGEELADSQDAEITEWDQSGYAVFVVPTFQLAHSPKAIADFTLAAINNGANRDDLARCRNGPCSERANGVAVLRKTMKTGSRR